jgi:hypothetical protein
MAEIIPDKQKYVAFDQQSNKLCNKNDDTNKLFKIFHQNIRGIKGKINELMIPLLNEESNIFCLTEHHIVDYEMDALCIPKYRLGAGYGRKKFKKGSVRILIREDLNFTNINLQKHCKEHDIEIVDIQLKLNGEKIIILSIYRASVGIMTIF